MKTTRISYEDLVTMPRGEYNTTIACLKAGPEAFRLLGIFWKKSVKWWVDGESGDIIFEYE